MADRAMLASKLCFRFKAPFLGLRSASEPSRRRPRSPRLSLPSRPTRSLTGAYRHFRHA